MTETFASDAERATAERERVAEANRVSMSRLKAEYGITLPYASADAWRPCKRSPGNIPGFARQFTILCTDGVVAWFIDVFDVLFYGHIQHFTGKVEPLHSVAKPTATAKPGASKPRSPKTPVPKITVSLALEALKNLSKPGM